MIQAQNESNLTYSIEMVVLILMALGTVFVFSAGANVRSEYNLQHFYSFTTIKQILFFPLAVAVMYAVSCFNYKRFSFNYSPLKSFILFLLLLSITLLTLALIPSIGIGIGTSKSFARRWLDIAPGPIYISFQPSELAKYSIILFLAAYLDKFADSIKQFWKRFIPACIIIAAIVGLIVTQDFGTAAFIALLSSLMLLIGRAKWWHFLTPLPAIIPAFYFAIITEPTRIERLKAFFKPELASSAKYQAEQSLIAISTGGIWGKGLGRGVSKYGHLPEDTTDFIFSIIAEELGFVGGTVIILGFVILLILGAILVIRCKDRFGRMLAAGIILTITIQAAINIGVVTRVLPTKGISLPFISAGGTSMLLSAAMVGILLNIAKQTSRQQEIPNE